MEGMYKKNKNKQTKPNKQKIMANTVLKVNPSKINNKARIPSSIYIKLCIRKLARETGGDKKASVVEKQIKVHIFADEMILLIIKLDNHMQILYIENHKEVRHGGMYL